MALTFDWYFSQLRKKEEHRARTAEAELRRRYRVLLKDTKNFLANEYFQLAQDGKLTYEIMRSKGLDPARLLDEMSMRLSGISAETSKMIQQVVEDVYELGYKGLVDAVQKATTSEELKVSLQGLKGVSAETIKAAVENPVAGLTLSDTLEKNRQSIIWNIKKEIGIGLTNGDRYETMARRIAKSLDDDYKKAMRIVRTEAGRAREAGHLASAKEINKTLEEGYTDERLVKTWKTMKDGVVRDTHEPMNGITVAMDEDFILPSGVKTQAPKQSGVAREDINCRCFVKYDLMNSEEFEKATGKARPENPKEKQVKNLEKQEADIIDEKGQALTEKTQIEKDMADLDSHQYANIWKDPVTVKDYEAKKDKIQAKKDYFNDQLAKTGDSKWIDLNDRLDAFVADGEDYLKLKNKLDVATARIKVLDDDLKDVRQKIMKAKGIDPDKLKVEIADLQKQLSDMVAADKKLTLKSKCKEFDKEKIKKVHESIDEDFDEVFFTLFDDDNMAEYISFNIPDSKHDAFKKALKKAVKSDAADPKELAKLQKALTDKQDELEAIIKRYGLEDDKFSQARKDAAYWFTDKNGSATAADAVYRAKAGEVWRNATKREKDYVYEYTRSYHKYNEPLRGIEYGTNKFVGVGNVDMDNIGVSYSGFKKGQIKAEIDDITSILDKSSYDFDIWVQRGCGRGGMDKFFGCDLSDFDLPEAELAAKLVGTTPTEYAFMSTGVAKGRGLNTSGGITLNIYAPAGTKMMYVEPISAFGGGSGRSWDGISTQSYIGHEAEMLLQRSTHFRVIKVEKSGGTIYVDMEVIGQG